MKATNEGGKLADIPNCTITVPNFSDGDIVLKALPEISDSKSAAYNDEPVIGRSTPLKTYSHSENRIITMQLHFFTTSAEDSNQNIKYLRALESCTYPRKGTGNLPFLPPPVCKIKCGKLLGDEGV